MPAMQIIECVPNFSEGRNKDTIDAIEQSINSVPDVKLLNIEPDADYNRTVVTFAGSAPAVLQAALNASAVAIERIDMSLHKGEHPRLGAVDVVPFVPIHRATMEDCVILAQEFGSTIAEQFNIPVYLYEYAATTPQRKNLANIRKGEYEGLPDKLADPNWTPDFGPAVFNKKSGATVTGARNILIAYNIILKTTHVSIAQEIALSIRESGRIVKDKFGIVKTDSSGNPVTIPGTLKAVKAIGVYLQRYNIVQVSTNILDYETTPLHRVYEEVKKQADFFGVEVAGSEIVGLVPLNALLCTGRYYSSDTTQTEQGLIERAVSNLGLNYLQQFEPSKKIIEYLI